MINEAISIQPLTGYQALPGCHCVTASLHKVCATNGYPASEEMLFGLGAGLGFMYWHQKGQPPFLGGRGNNDAFATDLSKRTGIVIEEHSTSSTKVAERELLRLLEAGQPAMIYADMAYLSYLNLPEDAHFGGHAIVVCGYDPATRQVLISDMAARQTGYKDHIFGTLSMEQLAQARSSKYQPFPPSNKWFTFDFTNAHAPRPEDAHEAIQQCTHAMLHAPITNLGVAGIKKAAQRVKQWPAIFDDAGLRMALWNAYVFVEIGGSGGGLFRYLYSRFLNEAAQVTGDALYADASRELEACADTWRAMVKPLANVLEEGDAVGLVPGVVNGLQKLHRMEGDLWQKLCNRQAGDA